MAPQLVVRAGNALDHLDNGIKAWVIVLICLVSVVIVAVIIYLAIIYYNKRQDYKSVPQRTLPNPNQDFSRKRKTLNSDRLGEEQELQRRSMIQKSLAERTSSQIDNRLSQMSNDDWEAHRSRPGSVINDWKEYEANIYRERSRSPENHPELQHPLLRSQEPCPLAAPSPIMAGAPRHSWRASVPSPLSVSARSDSQTPERQDQTGWQPPRTPPRPNFAPSTPPPRRGTPGVAADGRRLTPPSIERDENGQTWF